MTIRERIRTDRETIRSAPAGKKLQYFLEYYRWQLLIGLAVLIFIGSSIRTSLMAKDIFLSGIAVNCSPAMAAEPFRNLNDGLMDFAGQDKEEKELEINSALSYVPGSHRTAQENYATAQRIAVSTAAGTLDFVVGDAASMRDFAEAEWFADIRDFVLPELEPMLVYIGDSAMYLDVSSCPQIAENYMHLEEPVLLAFTVTAPHPEQSEIFMAYLAESMRTGG